MTGGLRLGRIGRTLAGAVMAAAFAAASHAQVVTAPVGDPQEAWTKLLAEATLPSLPMPADKDQLDDMVRQGRIPDLTRRLASIRTGQELEQDLNWERAAMLKGGGVDVPLAYLQDLWRGGVSEPPPAGDDVKQTAGMILLYVLAVIEVDGTQCGDQTAPNSHFVQLVAQGQPILAYMKTIPAPRRMSVGTIALWLEAATALVRSTDETLCRGGAEETAAGANAAAPGYKPRILSPDDWKPKRAEIRARMPAVLTRLLHAEGDAAAPPAAPARPTH